MSVEFVDTSKLRRASEAKEKLSRAVESREVARRADSEIAGPFAGLMRRSAAGAPPPTDADGRRKHVFREYVDGATGLLCKVADLKMAAKGSLEKELCKSVDVKTGMQDIFGTGVTNPFIGVAGAVVAACMRHATLQAAQPPPAKKDAAAPAARRPVQS